MLFRFLRNFFAILLAPWIMWRRARAVRQSGVVSFHIHGRVSEVSLPRAPRFRLPIGRRPKPATSLQRVRQLAELISADARVKMLRVELEPLEQGFAMAAALADVLAQVKAAGKHVHVHLPKGGGLRDYFVASAASSISMPPYAALNLVGIGAKTLYFKDALEKLHLEADVEQRHEYKSAAEPFARSRMSDKAREQSERLLNGVEKEVHGVIAARRPAALPDLLARGPYRADEAMKLGLIDSAEHDDKWDDDDETPAVRYLARRQARVWKPLRRKRLVAVVRVSGTIVDEGSAAGQASSEAVCGAAQAAMESRRVAAVVLLVDSRGGSAFASAQMHRALTKLGEKKPVVAYFSDYAASGGYYVATHAREIWANPLTVTGSIGVVSMRPVTDGLLEKLAIGKDGVTRGAHAGLLDMTGRWNEAEKAAMRRQIDLTYEEFTALVGDGRKLDAAAVDSVARGRVWLGAEAKEKRLVDGLGSFGDAVKRARELAGVRTETEPMLVGMPRFGLGSLLSWRGAGSSLTALFMRGPMTYEPFELIG